MPQLLSVNEFDQLFATFTRSAWRWESQAVYHEPSEVEPWQRWRDGLADDLEWLRPWLDDIRAATRAGKRFERVRMFTKPLTEYLRWQLDVTPANSAAGEDIRWLAEDRARQLDLPEYDFWLFDDQTVARMHFSDTGMTGAEIFTDSATVARHRAWRDVAWQHAIPFDEYRAGDIAERGT